MAQRLGHRELWTWGVLGGVLLAGMALRLYYAAHANLYIDEFTTIWAAQRVLGHGLPRLPLGAIYTQGLLYTYLEAGALLLGGGFHPLLSRWPSVLLAAGTLALAVYGAHRLYRLWPVGLAAFWLALDSQAIVWGGRARTYTLLQLFVLAAFLAWYRGAVASDQSGPRWLAIGFLLLALVDQPLILLLLPPLAILALFSRGWGWLRQPVVWLQAAVVALGLALRWFSYQLMILPGTTVTAEPRVFVDLTQPFAGWQPLAPFFTEPTRLIAGSLLVGGVLWLLVRRRLGMPPWGRPVLSTAFIVAFVMLEMLLIVGPTWRRTHYVYPLVPLLFLGAEGVAVVGLRGLADRLPFLSFRRALAVLTLAFVLLNVALIWPSTRAAATQNEWGYDRALAVVEENWLEGDALATIAPPAAFVVLDRGDYLAAEEGAQAMVVERDGRRLDSWTGLPLLDSPARLAAALEAHPRLWFVVDEMRLNRHFSREYLRLLWDRFDLVAFEWGTFVFRSRPAEAPPAVDRPLNADFEPHLRLAGYALSENPVEPGQVVTVTLRWEPIAPDGEYVASVQLLNREGETVAAHDAPPLGGLYPAFRWAWSSRSQPFPDRHPLALPADLSPGRYRLVASLHRPGSMEPVGEPLTLDFLSVGDGSEAVERPPASPAARFGDAVTLLSYDLAGEMVPGSTANLRLLWQAGPAGFDADYTVFIHLLDAEGQIAQQWDAPPDDGWYPTSYWDPGDIVLDDHRLDFSPQLPPGAYRLITGLYRADGTRLLLEDGADSVQIATVQLGS